MLVPAALHVTYNAATGVRGAIRCTTPTTISLAVISGVEYTGNDFGRTDAGSIGNRVWNDANNLGVRDAGEPGIPGVTLYLCNASPCSIANASATTATDASGAYLFQGLANGTYYVAVAAGTLPAGYTVTYDNFTGTDGTGRGIVSGGSTDGTVDFGYRNTTGFNVSGNVWNDANGNGVNNAETAIQNVKVCLYQTDGVTLVACTTTLANGNYTIPGVLGSPGGTGYVIQVETTTLPSNAYGQTGRPGSAGRPMHDLRQHDRIAVTAAAVTDKNFGHQQSLGSISGTVCCGTGAVPCGVVTTTFSGRYGAPYLCRDRRPPRVPPDDVVSAATTNVNGAYTFPNLAPGLYQIAKINPAGTTSLVDADGGNPNNIATASPRPDPDAARLQGDRGVGRHRRYRLADATATAFASRTRPGCPGLRCTFAPVRRA